jgi:hypothetical protein
MKVLQKSPTYVNIIDLLFKTQTMKMPLHQVSMQGGTFNRRITGVESEMLIQDFYVAASELFSACTPHEWHLIGRISSELKSYNALWVATAGMKRNSSVRKSIKGLIAKEILILTETTDIYLVNPKYVRRGDFKTVLVTTAVHLAASSKVTTDHVVNRRPINDFTHEPYMLLTNPLTDEK